MPKTNLNFQIGQYNSINRDKAIQLSQNIPFPTYYSAKASLYKAELKASEFLQQATSNELKAQVQSYFYQLQYLETTKKHLQKLDSLYDNFVVASALRYKTGETNMLEKATAETKRGQITQLLKQNEAELAMAYATLKSLMNTNENFVIAENPNFHPITLSNTMDTALVANNPSVKFLYQQAVVAEKTKKVEAASVLPDLTIGYFNQSLIGIQSIDGNDIYFDASKRFQGVNIGIGIPLTFFSSSARIKSMKYTQQSLVKEADNNKQVLKMQMENAFQQYSQNLSQYNYYKSTAMPNVDLIVSTANVSYKSGEIGYIEYLQALQTATDVRLSYLQSVDQLNQSIININFLINK